jgi:hypothetical protein
MRGSTSVGRDESRPYNAFPAHAGIDLPGIEASNARVIKGYEDLR